MRDGTLVSFELGEEPSRITLDSTDATNQEEEVRVYLAVPRFDPLSSSVAPPGAPEQSRSVVVRRSVQDDVTGSDDQEIEFRRPSVRILLSTDDLSGFELLPIAQIRNIRNREAVPEIDAA
jgi:type VI secretion system protein ImpJ